MHDLLGNFLCTDLVWKHCTKMNYFVKDLFSKGEQIRSYFQFFSHLLNKSLMDTWFCVCCNRHYIVHYNTPHVFPYIFHSSVRKARLDWKKKNQKQSTRGVFRLYWNHFSAWLFSCKLAAAFQNTAS